MASKSTSSLSLALPFSHFLSLSLASFFSSEWPTETKIYVKLEFRTKPRKWLKAFGHKDIFMLVHKSIRFIKDQTLTMDFFAVAAVAQLLKQNATQRGATELTRV